MYWLLIFSVLVVISCAILSTPIEADQCTHFKLCKRGEEAGNTQAQAATTSKVLFDLNSSPPLSPVENSVGHTVITNETTAAKKGNKRKSRFLSDEERQKFNCEYHKQRAKSFTKEGVEKAKATLQGSELKTFLLRAERYQSSKKKVEKQINKEVSNRFKTGTQTLQDEERRQKARQRAEKSREKRRRMSSDQ